MEHGFAGRAPAGCSESLPGRSGPPALFCFPPQWLVIIFYAIPVFPCNRVNVFIIGS